MFLSGRLGGLCEEEGTVIGVSQSWLEGTRVEQLCPGTGRSLAHCPGDKGTAGGGP